MTCIIWHRNKLLTDSTSVNGVEWVDDGRKLIPVNGPIFIQRDAEDIPDPIVGFTFIHSRKTATNFLTLLDTACSLTMNAGLEKGAWQSSTAALESQYKLMALSGVWNQDNFFRALLIGRDRNYTFAPCTVERDDCTETYDGLTPVEKGESIIMGNYPLDMAFQLKLNRKIEGIRAMHRSMHESHSVGGRVYEYQVFDTPFRDRRVEIGCTAMWEPPSRAVLQGANQNLAKPYPADLIYNKRSFAAQDRGGAKIGRESLTEYQRYVRVHAAHFKIPKFPRSK